KRVRVTGLSGSGMPPLCSGFPPDRRSGRVTRAARSSRPLVMGAAGHSGYTGVSPTPPRRRSAMPTPKTRHEREKELQALLATPEGQAELRALGERYEAAGGRVLHASKSIVTY